MRIVTLAIKDLAQIARDWKSAIFLVLMPILFTLFFGFAFQVSEADSRLPVGWYNGNPGGAVSDGLEDMLAASDSIRLVPMADQDVARVDSLIRKGTLAAAVLVPNGFGDQASAGKAVPLTLVAPNTPAGQTVTSAVQGALSRALGSTEAARLSAEAVEAVAPFADATARQAFLEEGNEMATAAWQQPALGLQVEHAVGAGDPVLVASGFVQSSPGMIVQFAIFGLITSAMVLVLERKCGALQRMLTTTMRPAQVLAGHVLAMFIVAFLQGLLLISLGQLFFGVGYLREPVATVLVMAALALWSASLGLLIGALCRHEEQVVALSLIAMFMFAVLGGAWFPLQVAGATFASVGHLLPTAWAMDGFQNIVLRGQGLGSVFLPSAVVLGYAAAFFGLAVWRFRFE